MEKVRWLRDNCIRPPRRFHGRTLAQSQGGWAHGHLGMVRKVLGVEEEVLPAGSCFWLQKAGGSFALTKKDGLGLVCPRVGGRHQSPAP